MDSQTFLDNFGIIAEAPGGVDRLRELILNLAFSAQLVPQQSDDSPVDIDWSAAALKLDKQKLWGQTFITDVPDSWRVVPMARLGKWGSGGTPTRNNKAYYGGNIPWLVIGDLNDGLVTSAETHITVKGLSESSATLVPVGAVLIAMYGSIGKSGVTGFECATNQAIAHCIPDTSIVSTEFLFRLIHGLRPRLFAQGRGMAQQNISQTILKHLMIALPPREEQGRIVQKVDELMTLCDELEAAKEKRDSLRTAARKSAIDAISTATTLDELGTAWTRIKNYWGTFCDSTEAISSLRSTIIKLAVEQKLLPISDFDKTSDPQVGRLDEVLVLEYGKPLERQSRSMDASIPAYGANGIKTYTTAPLVNTRGIVVGRKGSAGQVNITDGPFWPLDVTFFARFDESLNDVGYLYYLLKSLDLPDLARGIKPGINRNDVHQISVFKVSRDVQVKIVRKVDELMFLCDELERSLVTQLTIQQNLAMSVSQFV